LFADSFNRQIPPDRGLGSDWTVSGAWFADGRAISDLDSGNRALANPVRCADCSVAASVISFGVPEVGVVLRQDAAGNRYELVLAGNGTLRLRRVRNGVTTLLAQGASGAGPANASVRLELTATGAAPVSLLARVDGVTRLSASDATTPLGAAGAAGLWSSSAGVPFDELVVTAR
jgi:hypothetical protein